VFTRAFTGALAAVALLVAGAPVAANAEPAAPQAANERPNAPPVTDGAPRGRGRLSGGPSPAQTLAQAQAVATAANATCELTGAIVRGKLERANVFEATCATGPGLILIASTPPQAIDCVILAGQADITRAANPAADVGLQCTIPANLDVTKVVAEYAKTAGVACTVDQGASVGRSSGGNIIYEAGCAGVDGYWLEKTPTGWTITECQKVVTTNGKCRFTTPAEQAATLKKWFEGSAASACDVAQARYMGSNANGSFYEAKCAAGDGLIARFDTAMAVQQVYPCAEAQRIGGGCTLTGAPAPVAAPAPAAAPATQQ